MIRSYAQVAAVPRKAPVQVQKPAEKLEKKLNIDADFPAVDVKSEPEPEGNIDQFIAGFEKLAKRLEIENAKLIQLPVGKPSADYPDVEHAPRYISMYIDATKFPTMAKALTHRIDRSRSDMPRFPLPLEMHAPIMRADYPTHQMVAIRIKATADMVKLRNNIYKKCAHIKPASDGTWTSVLLIINNYPGKWAVFEDHHPKYGYEPMKEMIRMRHEHRVHKKMLTCFDGCKYCPFPSTIGEPGIDVFSNMLTGIDGDFQIV